MNLEARKKSDWYLQKVVNFVNVTLILIINLNHNIQTKGIELTNQSN